MSVSANTELTISTAGRSLSLTSHIHRCFLWSFVWKCRWNKPGWLFITFLNWHVDVHESLYEKNHDASCLRNAIVLFKGKGFFFRINACSNGVRNNKIKSQKSVNRVFFVFNFCCHSSSFETSTKPFSETTGTGVQFLSAWWSPIYCFTSVLQLSDGNKLSHTTSPC